MSPTTCNIVNILLYFCQFCIVLNVLIVIQALILICSDTIYFFVVIQCNHVLLTTSNLNKFTIFYLYIRLIVFIVIYLYLNAVNQLFFGRYSQLIIFAFPTSKYFMIFVYPITLSKPCCKSLYTFLILFI
jgi:hypothetical protein